MRRNNNTPKVVISFFYVKFGADIDAEFGDNFGTEIGAEIVAEIDAEIGTDFRANFRDDFEVEIGTKFGAEFDAKFGAEFGADFSTDFVAETRVITIQPLIKHTQNRGVGHGAPPGPPLTSGEGSGGSTPPVRFSY